MAKFFKERGVKNNLINNRIAKQLWAEIVRIKGRQDGNLPAYMSDSPRGIQLSERHQSDGMSVYIQELNNPHRVLAYPVKHAALRSNTTSKTRLDWAALGKIVVGGRPIVVAGESIKINDASIDILRAKSNPEYLEMVSRKQEVTSRFGPLFRRPSQLTETEFRDFLLFKHNHHWTSLYRQSPNLFAQGLEHLRSTIAILADESLPIEGRYDRAVGRQKGMAKGIATAILTVAYPDKYGVWNTTSEGGLIQLGKWPGLRRGASEGDTYKAINAVLHDLSKTYDVDLWSLDGLLYFIRQPEDEDFPDVPLISESARVGSRTENKNVFDGIAKRILTTVAMSGTISERIAKEKLTDMTADELAVHMRELFELQQGKCKLTGIPMSTEPGGWLAISPDRIDSSLGYTRGNIQLTVWAANKAKGDTSDTDFRQFIRMVREAGKL